MKRSLTVVFAVAALAVRSAAAQDLVPNPAPPQDTSRPPLERIAVLAATLTPAAATGAFWGFAEGAQNEWRWANVQDGPGSPREAELNRRWHAYATGARVMVAVDIGAALGIGAATRPDWRETAALAGTSTLALLLSHHLAHNVQQGQPLLYFGQVAPTDRLARRVGPGVVATATAIGTGAVLYLAYRVLD